MKIQDHTLTKIEDWVAEKDGITAYRASVRDAIQAIKLTAGKYGHEIFVNILHESDCI